MATPDIYSVRQGYVEQWMKMVPTLPAFSSTPLSGSSVATWVGHYFLLLVWIVVAIIYYPCAYAIGFILIAAKILFLSDVPWYKKLGGAAVVAGLITGIYFIVIKWAAVSTFLLKPEFTGPFLLVVLFIIYYWAPRFFSTALLLAIVAFLTTITFSLDLVNKTGAEARKNHWLVWIILVLPIIPVILSLTRLESKLIQGLLVAAYIALVSIIMLLNPASLLQPEHYSSGNAYIIAGVALVAIIAVAMMKTLGGDDKYPEYLQKAGFMLICCAAIGFGLAYSVQLLMTAHKWSTRYILGLIIVIVAGTFALRMLYRKAKDVNMSWVYYFSNANLVLRTLSLASCLTADMLSFILSEPKQTYVILLIEIILIIWWALAPKTYSAIQATPTGKSMVKDPVPLNTQLLLVMNNTPLSYNYAISTWIYLHAQPPNENPEANEFVNVIDYGGKPAVSYNSARNTLRISMKQPPGAMKAEGLDALLETVQGRDNPMIRTDRAVDIMVAEIPNMPLQKWNHFVFYYNNGTFDIFMNGELYKSVRAMVAKTDAPLVIGASNGNSGQLCNTVFFKGNYRVTNAYFQNGEAITIDKVRALYQNFKSKNPPVPRRLFSIAK